MSTSDPSFIDGVIDGGEAEMRRLDGVIERAHRDKDIVAEIVRQARLLRPDSAQAEPTTERTVMRWDGIAKDPVMVTARVTNWEGARSVLLRTGRALSAPEIAREMKKDGFVLTENGAEVIRAAMIRKTDIFKQKGQGLYGLVAWEDAVPQQEAS